MPDANIPKGPLNKGNYRFETLQIHKGQEEPDPVFGSRAVPIHLTSSYVFKNSQEAADRFALKKGGDIYSRLSNPTQSVFEERIAALEGGSAAIATSSGAAAVAYALSALALSGDHIVAANNIYGGTFNFLAHTFKKNYGVETTFVDPADPKNIEDAIRPNTKAIFVETFGNPNASVTDVDAIAGIAHRHRVAFVVDNTFATPYLFRPLEHGADVVVESATKFISGHGTVIAGVLVESGKTDWKALGKYPQLTEPDDSYHGVVFADEFPDTALCAYVRFILLHDVGACLSPFSCWILLESLETLSLRVDRQVENTLRIVEYLSKNPKVSYVSHPCLPDNPTHALYEKYFPNGGGSIFTFDVKGTKAQAAALTEKLHVFSLLANVADMKSLIIHPATTTHGTLTDEELAAANIGPTTIRMSVGAEHIDDLIADLQQAFDQI